jgi:Gti1/Pac2 family transcription factor
MMETYFGYVRTPADAIKLFEACRMGLLPRVQRRLSEKERMSIRSGSVYVWDEREAGMRRWTDGKSWSASRVSGSFLTYREMEGKRGGGFGAQPTRRGAGKTPDSGRGSDEDQDEGEPDGYRYKVDGLMKQSFSITTQNGQHLHLISYYARPQPGEPEMVQPTTDPALRHVVPAKGMYPESSMNEAQGPALTRGPMQQSGYPSQQHQHPLPPAQPYPPQYAQQGYVWPPSPVATPPYSHYNTAPYPYHPAPHPHHGPPPPHHGPHPHAPYYQYPPQHQQHHYDARQPLPPLQSTSLPPREHQYAAQPRQYEPPHPQKGLRIDPHLGQRPNHLPALTNSAITTQVGPQRIGSVSPPRSSHSDTANGVVNGVNGDASKQASLSALIHHPTPSNSEPSSANPASVNSANSSPRTASGPQAPVQLVQATLSPASTAAAAVAAANGAGQQKARMMALGDAPREIHHEDTRTKNVLDKKFHL